MSQKIHTFPILRKTDSKDIPDTIKNSHMMSKRDVIKVDTKILRRLHIGSGVRMHIRVATTSHSNRAVVFVQGRLPSPECDWMHNERIW